MNDAINRLEAEKVRAQNCALYYQNLAAELQISIERLVQLKMSGQIVTIDQAVPAETKKKSVREIVLEAIESGVPKTTAALRKACLQKYPEDSLRIRTNLSCVFAKLRSEGIEIETSQPRTKPTILNGDRQHNENHEVTVRT